MQCRLRSRCDRPVHVRTLRWPYLLLMGRSNACVLLKATSRLFAHCLHYGPAAPQLVASSMPPYAMFAWSQWCASTIAWEPGPAAVDHDASACVAGV